MRVRFFGTPGSIATPGPPAPDQPEPPYWRITELYFQSVDDLQKWVSIRGG